MASLGTPLSAARAADDAMTVHAGERSLDDLLNVVAAASRTRTRVRLTGVKAKPIEDLMRIAVTGGDCVVFEPDGDRAAPPPRRRWFFRS